MATYLVEYSFVVNADSEDLVPQAVSEYVRSSSMALLSPDYIQILEDDEF